MYWTLGGTWATGTLKRMGYGSSGQEIGKFPPPRFPNGITYVADKNKEAGMTPGLWFEIEIFGIESQNYQLKQELMMRNGNSLVEDNSRRFLYFGSEETRKFATEVLERYMDCGFAQS